MGERVLGCEEFVARMLANKRCQRDAVEMSRKARPSRVDDDGKTRKRVTGNRAAYGSYENCGMHMAVPLVRDDGTAYRTIKDALIAAGYNAAGVSAAKKRVEDGKAWRDGHVYMFASK